MQSTEMELAGEGGEGPCFILVRLAAEMSTTQR